MAIEPLLAEVAALRGAAESLLEHEQVDAKVAHDLRNYVNRLSLCAVILARAIRRDDAASMAQASLRMERAMNEASRAVHQFRERGRADGS